MKTFKNIITAALLIALSFTVCIGFCGCTQKVNETAYYVSPNGSDENDGSKNKPFATPEKAVEAVRETIAGGLEKPVTVYFHAGDYKITNITLTEADSGTAEYPVTYKAYGDGEVIFNGGKTLANADFKPVTDENILSRLKDDVKDKIRVIDLAAQGYTLEDIGNLYAWGAYSTAKKYDDGTLGNNCELFWNEQRLTIARYPDTGFLKFNGVVDEGNQAELIPGTLKVDEETLEVIKTWEEPEKAWVFAYFQFDWADMTTPVKNINIDEGTLTPQHYSSMGYKDEGSYYFFNVLEELDSEGEYYIDRDNMLIYVYPPEDSQGADAEISLIDDNLISGQDLSYVNFEEISFKCSRKNAVQIVGNNITFRNCKVTNIYLNAILIDGCDNLVYGCEVAYIGREGVVLMKGGDRATLTPGNNVIENCYIHHFGQVYRTYASGARVGYVGGKIIHNEIAYAPHSAMSYTGSDNLVAYNYIHHVVTDSSDAGALYCGGTLSMYGNVVKFNIFEDIGGTEGKFPKAIYMDDGMSGQTIYGNIIINCSGNAINIGGGRENTIVNNLTIDCGGPIYYDDRFAVDGGSENLADALMGTLKDVPYTEDPWKSRFPLLANVTTDHADYMSPDYAANPSYSLVENNIFIGKKADRTFWKISENVYRYSTIGINYSYAATSEILEDGTYTVKELPIFLNNMKWEQIPYTEIGRYKTED